MREWYAEVGIETESSDSRDSPLSSQEEDNLRRRSTKTNKQERPSAAAIRKVRDDEAALVEAAIAADQSLQSLLCKSITIEIGRQFVRSDPVVKG